LIFGPGRNGALDEFGIRERLRLFGESFGELQGLIDLVADGPLRVEPAEPAEISEDGAADLGGLAGQQIALGFEFAAEDGVSRLVAIGRADDALCKAHA